MMHLPLSLLSPSHDPTLLNLTFVVSKHTFPSFSEPLHMMFPLPDLFFTLLSI